MKQLSLLFLLSLSVAAQKFIGILPGGSSHMKTFPLRGITYGNNDMVFDTPPDYYDTDFYIQILYIPTQEVL